LYTPVKASMERRMIAEDRARDQGSKHEVCLPLP
jgi:hypothetical protein